MTLICVKWVRVRVNECVWVWYDDTIQSDTLSVFKMHANAIHEPNQPMCSIIFFHVLSTQSFFPVMSYEFPFQLTFIVLYNAHNQLIDFLYRTRIVSAEMCMCEWNGKNSIFNIQNQNATNCTLEHIACWPFTEKINDGKHSS